MGPEGLGNGADLTTGSPAATPTPPPAAPAEPEEKHEAEREAGPRATPRKSKPKPKVKSVKHGARAAVRMGKEAVAPHRKEKTVPRKAKAASTYSNGKKTGMAVTPEVARNIRKLRAKFELKSGERPTIAETVNRAVLAMLKTA